MSRYSKQLQEEVKRRNAETRETFDLSDDKKLLLPSYGSLVAVDVVDATGSVDSSLEWRQAVNNYKKTNSFRQRSIHADKCSHSRRSIRRMDDGRSYASSPYSLLLGENPLGRLLVQLVMTCLVSYTLLILFGPLVIETMPRSDWCPILNDSGQDTISNSTTLEKKYDNPDHVNDPCRYTRLPLLLYLTIEEADLCRRMLASVLMGGAIGYERKSADRPAGVRTMGLVSLGSCFFTISSQLAFKNSTMGWDASRVTAAIPSGCGFLGAGLIWKGTIGSGKDERHEVHGLTTAAGVWLSAAIGVGCGGKLYFVSGYSCMLVTMILRYGSKKVFFYERENDDADICSDYDTDSKSDNGNTIDGNEEHCRNVLNEVKK